MRSVYLSLCCLAMTQTSAVAQTTPQAPSGLEFKAALARLDRIEERLDALEKRKAVNALADSFDCGCSDGKRCTCGVNCPCPAVKAAASPKLVQWSYNGSTVWVPEGYSLPGGVRVGAGPTEWDCSSGVCRPASSGVTYGGSCAGGSCGTSYGGSYGSFSPAYGFGSAGSFGGGGCAGGSCGAPSSGGFGFRRR